MFLIRSVKTSDYSALLALSRELDTVNLPTHPPDIRKMIQRSRQSFAGKWGHDKRHAQFLWVMEDTETGSVIGTSKIFAQHGSPQKPHVYFQVKHQKMSSRSLNVDFTRTMYRLKCDTRGITEIGGLVLDPAYRKRPGHLGKQMSYIRFMFMKAHPGYFKQRVIAELLPPLHDGQSTLWNFYGYPLTRLPYRKADRMSYKTKEFILRLFPQADLYHDILPPKVQRDMGQTGAGSTAARHMLQKIGFRYAEQVDPFDGGPYYVARRSEIRVYRETKRFRYGGVASGRRMKSALVMIEEGPEIRALLTPCAHQGAFLYLPQASAEILDIIEKQPVYRYNWK